MSSPTQSKYVLTKSPMLPAYCAGCRKSANGIVNFVDFQLDLDYYGAVVFCEDCAKEICGVLDMVPVADLFDAVAKIEALAAANRELTEENERVRAALDSILSVRPDLRSDSDRDDDVDNSESEPAEQGTKGK